MFFSLQPDKYLPYHIKFLKHNFWPIAKKTSAAVTSVYGYAMKAGSISFRGAKLIGATAHKIYIYRRTITACVAARWAVQHFLIPWQKRQQHTNHITYSNYYKYTFRQFSSHHINRPVYPQYHNSSHPIEASDRRTNYRAVAKFLKSKNISYFEVHKGYHGGAGYQTINGPSDLHKDVSQPEGVLSVLCGSEFYHMPGFWEADVLLVSLADWYIDSDLLLSFRKPIVLITKEPYMLAYQNSEVSMVATTNGIYKFDVIGGGTYSHRIHRYDRDHISGPLSHPLNDTTQILHPNYRQSNYSQSNVFSIDRFPLQGIDLLVFLTPLSDSYSVPLPTLEKDFFHTYDCGSAQYNVQLVVSPVTDPVSGTTTMTQTLYYQTPMSDKVGSVPYSSILMINTIAENNTLTTGNVAQLHNSFEDNDTQVTKFLSLHLRPHREKIFERRYIPAQRYDHGKPLPEQIFEKPETPRSYAQNHPYYAAFMNPAAAVARCFNSAISRGEFELPGIQTPHTNPHTIPSQVFIPTLAPTPQPQQQAYSDLPPTQQQAYSVLPPTSPSGPQSPQPTSPPSSPNPLLNHPTLIPQTAYPSESSGDDSDFSLSTSYSYESSIDQEWDETAPNPPASYLGSRMNGYFKLPQFVPTPPRHITINSGFIPDLDFDFGQTLKLEDPGWEGERSERRKQMTKRERLAAEAHWTKDLDDSDVHHHLLSDGKPMMVKTGPDFCHMPNVSVNTKSNLSQIEAIIMRITAVNPDDGTQEFLDSKEGPIRTAFQLWEKLFGGEQIEPLDPEEVAAQNTDSNQKKRFQGYLERTTFQDVRKAGSYFTKAEANIDKEDPKTRNISNVDDRYIIELSRYTIALKKRINDILPGYLFSKTNAQTGEYVHRVASYFGHKSVCDENDHSGFDGHQHAASMLLELGPYYVAMNAHYKDVAKLLEQTHVSCFKSIDHLTVNPGYTRLSGCATTSINNSIIGLIIPCLSRIYTDPSTYSTFIDISGYTSERIRKLFNLTYGAGDDANTYNIDSDNLVSFAKYMGFDLKNVSYKATDPTVILGSVFPAPGGSSSAHNDYKRQLSKLHLSTINPRFTKHEQFAMKATGVLVSNFGSAPDLSAMLSNLTHLTGAQVTADIFDKDMPYNARFGQYNRTDPFTNDLDVENMPDGFHDIMQDVSKISSVEDLQKYADIIEPPPTGLSHDRAKDRLRQVIADTQPTRVPIVGNLWENLNKQEKSECSKDITGAVALEAIQQIAAKSQHGVYIVDLTPGPEILARTVCDALPEVSYYSYHHIVNKYDRAKQLQHIQPVGKNHRRPPLPNNLTELIVAEESKPKKKTMILIIDPPWVEKSVAKGLFSGNVSSRHVLSVVEKFLSKLNLPSTGTHPPDVQILLHLPAELKTNIPGFKVIQAPVYSHVFYTNCLGMAPINITVSATKRDAMPKVISKYLERILEITPLTKNHHKKDHRLSKKHSKHLTPEADTPRVEASPPPTPPGPEEATAEDGPTNTQKWSHVPINKHTRKNKPSKGNPHKK